MIAAPLPLAELTRRAVNLLTKEFGPADTARFVGQYSIGSGDYTVDRDAMFAGMTVSQLADEIRASVATNPHK